MPLDRTALEPALLLPRDTLPRLACGYRLAEVIDQRADGGAAGSLGAHAFSLDDAAGLVRRRLLASGFSQAGDASLPALSLQLRQLYIASNQTSKVPVAVYRVSFDDDAPIVIRSRATTVNWNGSEAESRRALTRALDDADLQLLQAVNARCGRGRHPKR